MLSFSLVLWNDSSLSVIEFRMVSPNQMVSTLVTNARRRLANVAQVVTLPGIAAGSVSNRLCAYNLKS